MALKNFDPAEFIHTEGFDPQEGTKWRRWWDSKEPKIDCGYARAMWPWLTDASNCFISPDVNWNPPEPYRYGSAPGSHGLAVRRVAQDLNCYFDSIGSLLTSEGQDILAPFAFQSVMSRDGLLRRDYVRSMAAYSIYCQDLAITGLLSAAPQMGASGSAYAIVALDLAHRDQTLIMQAGRSILGSDLAAATARSRLASHAAMTRHRTSQASKTKTEILQYLFQHNHRYKSKAEFVRTMLDKFPDTVISHKTIERYVAESGCIVPHWKSRRRLPEQS